MALSINVKVTGSQDFMQKLATLGAGLTNFKPALSKIGKELTDYYSGQVFESWGVQFGTPWAQLSASTIAYKTKHSYVYAAVPLMATGTMRKSFRSTPSARKLVIDNTAPYFKYHQSSESRHKLPRRQMLGISNDVKQIIKQVITADIHKKIAGL